LYKGTGIHELPVGSKLVFTEIFKIGNPIKKGTKIEIIILRAVFIVLLS